MKSRIDIIVNIVAPAILVIVFIIMVIIGVFEQEEFNDANGKYTIGVVLDAYPTKGIPVIKFKYIVSGAILKGQSGKKGNKKMIGKRYFVKYLEDSPERASIIVKINIPDSVKFNIPYNGWDAIPEY